MYNSSYFSMKTDIVCNSIESLSKPCYERAIDV